MPLTTQRDATRPSGFAVWRIVVWLMLLLAAFGCLQYALHAQQVWGALQTSGSAEATAHLRGVLAWDLAYLAGAFAIIVVCAGAILRQAWSRVALQIAAVLLAIWALVSGITLFAQWHNVDNAAALLQSGADEAAQQTLGRLRRNFAMAVGLKALAVPVLLWLAWRLSRPAVREQFRSRGR
ncbi:hypothetical protein ISN76_17760 [Dyella halodurans]|uniref:DUF1772 domain-containing protein n=1 Tax=Dyella halodurans TaxID=1920171 RepID=A0ABV9C7R6_9GAMM|nr:hypothetical protein [Dyella halodurans]